MTVTYNILASTSKPSVYGNPLGHVSLHGCKMQLFVGFRVYGHLKATSKITASHS